MKRYFICTLFAVAFLLLPLSVIIYANNTVDIRILEEKAINGDIEAQFNLGFMYAKGQGVRQDYQKALEWYEKAANQGDTKAQYNLGFMFNKGQGLRQDYRKAAEWYEKAANQGHTKAQFNLGIMFDKG